MRPTPRHLLRVLCIATVATLSAVLVPASALAAESSALVISKIDTTRAPTIRFAFQLDTDSKRLPHFDLTENGHAVKNFNVYYGRLGLYESKPKPVLLLALDTSESMRGPKLEAAKAAALALVDQARNGDRIGVVSFGKDAELVQQPTDDLDAVRSAIQGVDVTYGTALFDGVRMAAKSFPSDATRKVVVVLSDGADLGSTHSQASAINAATDAKAEIWSVAITGPGFDPGPLAAMSNETGGDLSKVSGTAGLSGLFADLGRSLLRGYWIEYRSSQPGAVPVKVRLAADGFDPAVYSYTSPKQELNGHAVKVTPPPLVKPEKPLVHLPGGGFGQLLAALPFAFLVGFLLWLQLQKGSRPNVQARIEPYTRRPAATQVQQDIRDKRESMLQPLFRVTEGFLGTSALFRRFHKLLEQANLPLREVEMLYMMIGGGLVFTFFAFLFSHSLISTAIVGLIGFFLPYMWLRFKARKRKKKFEEQLADVLGTIASSLKAGHSFNQAINAIIKETPNPTSEEFQRVMTEARLGLPIEDALEGMAVRMDSEDFEFAVTTVNIQRTVGGSLSEILEMVGDTVRNRQQFRKKVKALTSMGTMSAYVLLGLPIFLAGVLTLLNRDYIAPLFNTPTGHKLLIAGAFFMILGYLSCMKIVRIKT